MRATDDSFSSILLPCSKSSDPYDIFSSISLPCSKSSDPYFSSSIGKLESSTWRTTDAAAAATTPLIQQLSWRTILLIF